MVLYIAYTSLFIGFSLFLLYGLRLKYLNYKTHKQKLENSENYKKLYSTPRAAVKPISGLQKKTIQNFPVIKSPQTRPKTIVMEPYQEPKKFIPEINWSLAYTPNLSSKFLNN